MAVFIVELQVESASNDLRRIEQDIERALHLEALYPKVISIKKLRFRGAVGGRAFTTPDHDIPMDEEARLRGEN